MALGYSSAPGKPQLNHNSKFKFYPFILENKILIFLHAHIVFLRCGRGSEHWLIGGHRLVGNRGEGKHLQTRHKQHEQLSACQRLAQTLPFTQAERNQLYKYLCNIFVDIKQEFLTFSNVSLFAVFMSSMRNRSGRNSFGCSNTFASLSTADICGRIVTPAGILYPLIVTSSKKVNKNQFKENN